MIQGHGVKRTARAVLLDIKPDGSVVTKEPEHANVAILPVRGKNMEVLDLVGQKDPVRGWFALFAIQPSHEIVYRCRTALPWHFETVIQPLPPGRADVKQVQPQPVTCEGSGMCAGLSYGNDLFLLSYDGPALMTCGDVRYHGTALLLSRDQRGHAVRASMVDGRLLRLAEKELFSTDAPAPVRTMDW